MYQVHILGVRHWAVKFLVTEIKILFLYTFSYFLIFLDAFQYFALKLKLTFELCNWIVRSGEYLFWYFSLCLICKKELLNEWKREKWTSEKPLQCPFFFVDQIPDEYLDLKESIPIFTVCVQFIVLSIKPQTSLIVGKPRHLLYHSATQLALVYVFLNSFLGKLCF